MPFKHQLDCYRTFDGVGWPNYSDILSEAYAKKVDELRQAGMRFRIIKHLDGYKQAFMHPDDYARSDRAEE